MVTLSGIKKAAVKLFYGGLPNGDLDKAILYMEKSKSLEAVTDSLNGGKKRFSWLEWNDKEMSGIFLNLPDRAEIPENIKEQLIVELYSK